MRNLSFSLALVLVTSAYVMAQVEGQRKDIRAGTSGQSESLRGLKGVSLVVDFFNKDEAMDVAEARAALKVLQDDARAQMQKAGIRLLDAIEIEDAGSPKLWMRFSISKPDNSGLGLPVKVELKLHQQANLWRDSSIEMSLLTWEAAGFTGPGVNLAQMQRMSRDLFDRIIKDYLAANPK